MKDIYGKRIRGKKLEALKILYNCYSCSPMTLGEARKTLDENGFKSSFNTMRALMNSKYFIRNNLELIIDEERLKQEGIITDS